MGSPEFSPLLGTAPHPPPPHQLPQAVLMAVGQAHPRISQMPGLFPAQHSWEGSARGVRSAPLLPRPPCSPPRRGKGALVYTCHSTGSEPEPSLLISQLGLVKVHGGNSCPGRRGESRLVFPDGSTERSQSPGEFSNSRTSLRASDSGELGWELGISYFIHSVEGQPLTVLHFQGPGGQGGPALGSEKG